MKGFQLSTRHLASSSTAVKILESTCKLIGDMFKNKVAPKKLTFSSKYFDANFLLPNHIGITFHNNWWFTINYLHYIGCFTIRYCENLSANDTARLWPMYRLPRSTLRNSGTIFNTSAAQSIAYCVSIHTRLGTLSNTFSKI